MAPPPKRGRRVAGEDKNAAFAAGLSTVRLQYQALAVARALSGLAGSHLALASTKTWQDGMTAGLREVFAGTAK